MYAGTPTRGRNTMGRIQAILKAELPSWLIIYTTATSKSATETVCTVAKLPWK